MEQHEGESELTRLHEEVKLRRKEYEESKEAYEMAKNKNDAYNRRCVSREQLDDYPHIKQKVVDSARDIHSKHEALLKEAEHRLAKHPYSYKSGLRPNTYDFKHNRDWHSLMHPFDKYESD